SLVHPQRQKALHLRAKSSQHTREHRQRGDAIHIVLYGDYDVDGVTSLAMLTRVLRAFGAEVECFLPLRMDEGYGLTPEGVARCLETLRPRLLVAVDCGTSSATEI